MVHRSLQLLCQGLQLGLVKRARPGRCRRACSIGGGVPLESQPQEGREEASHAALRLPDWDYCTPAELRLVVDSFNAAQELIHHLKRARRIDPALMQLLPVALHWIKALGYQLVDLRHFQRRQLGMGEGWR